MSYLFTSESVSEGHPDKVADQISDAILDAYLAKDPDSRVAVETLVTTNRIILAGEIKSTAKDIPHEKIALEVVRQIGYTRPELKFSYQKAKVKSYLHAQSKDISDGVDRPKEKDQGAGDQGMMFGYACRESDLVGDRPKVYMPLPLTYAHRLMRELAHIRKNTSKMPYLRPDAKCQVTVEYDAKGITPEKVHTIVLSTQHEEGVCQETIKQDIRKLLIPKVIAKEHRPDDDYILKVNPTGSFVIGGPHGDAGLTGRKIIVDTYGGRGAHGGGAFSGKDPSKVDRSAAYAARHVAKNIVAAGLADSVEIQVAYAIGEPDPVSVFVDSSGTVTGDLTDHCLIEIVRNVFCLRPAAIIKRLNLKRPIYQETATYGHFGGPHRPWEQLDFVDRLRAEAGL